MRKVAFVFVVAVIAPSLMLAWLAVRSLRNQQFAIERQQSLLCQGVADGLAEEISIRLEDLQAEFSERVESILSSQSPQSVAPDFDRLIRDQWEWAEVGFAVRLPGTLVCPSPVDSALTQAFWRDNGDFLGNREIAQVYGNIAYNSPASQKSRNEFQNWKDLPSQTQQLTEYSQSIETDPESQLQQTTQSRLNLGKPQSRKVAPVQQLDLMQQGAYQVDDANTSRLVPAEAEFAQLVSGATDGMLARFLQNQLKVMFWHRANADPNLVLGAQLDLSRVTQDLRELVRVNSLLQEDVCVALLDDMARPVALSRKGFQTDWKRPFVATEISDALPHWEVGAYLIDPDSLAQAARSAKLMLGLLVTLLVIAIGVGSWLIVMDLNRQLHLTRQKTDFVSNVSHELKTPLTSIRMFSELLADGKVRDPVKQRSYLKIIAAESARLTRLINNVLDFARMDRDEKKYEFKTADLGVLLSETLDAYRPHLESQGFELVFHPTALQLPVECDRDAVAQVLVNLLSNAEKYSNGFKDITVQVQSHDNPVRHAEIRVLDRGPGVPRGCEQKIFEQFYRADDSLNTGVQGSGLGLTLARQIARAHNGDLTYQPREGGGSCFTLSLPLLPTTDKRE